MPWQPDTMQEESCDSAPMELMLCTSSGLNCDGAGIWAHKSYCWASPAADRMKKRAGADRSRLRINACCFSHKALHYCDRRGQDIFCF